MKSLTLEPVYIICRLGTHIPGGALYVLYVHVHNRPFSTYFHQGAWFICMDRDIFSLGVFLWEFMESRELFTEEFTGNYHGPDPDLPMIRAVVN